MFGRSWCKSRLSKSEWRERGRARGRRPKQSECQLRSRQSKVVSNCSGNHFRVCRNRAAATIKAKDSRDAECGSTTEPSLRVTWCLRAGDLFSRYSSLPRLSLLPTTHSTLQLTCTHNFNLPSPLSTSLQNVYPKQKTTSVHQSLLSIPPLLVLTLNSLDFMLRTMIGGTRFCTV